MLEKINKQKIKRESFWEDVIIGISILLGLYGVIMAVLSL